MGVVVGGWVGGVVLRWAVAVGCSTGDLRALAEARRRLSDIANMEAEIMSEVERLYAFFRSEGKGRCGEEGRGCGQEGMGVKKWFVFIKTIAFEGGGCFVEWVCGGG